LKLVIYIPCQNEEENLAEAIRDLPDAIEGISEIQVILVDDCSTDNSVEIARECGVTSIVSLKHRKGLAYVYSEAFKASLAGGQILLSAMMVITNTVAKTCRH
jgi:glycosyltransferase involved in cell wall biosynthesis